MGGMSEYHELGQHRKATRVTKKSYATGGPGFRDGHDGTTSQATAAKVARKLSDNEIAVIGALKKQRTYALEHNRASGMTADEIADALNWCVTRVRPRLTGLRDKKRIVKTELSRASKRGGNPSAVWRVL